MKTPKTEAMPKNDDPGFFVTAAEIEKAKELGTEFSHIEQHQKSLRGDYQDHLIEAVQARYVAAPTDENFVTFKAALIEKETYFAFGIRKLTVIVESAHNNFVQERLLPFVRPIIIRNLELARRKLAVVTEGENVKHIETFGTPVGDSELIYQAKGTVAELEGLLADANKNAATAQILRILSRIKSFPVVAASEA